MNIIINNFNPFRTLFSDLSVVLMFCSGQIVRKYINTFEHLQLKFRSHKRYEKYNFYNTLIIIQNACLEEHSDEFHILF